VAESLIQSDGSSSSEEQGCMLCDAVLKLNASTTDCAVLCRWCARSRAVLLLSALRSA
jgi:hypothetical protein